MPAADKSSLSLPTLHGACVVPSKLRSPLSIYSVAFYPYSDAAGDPIFAFTRCRETYVCQVLPGSNNSDKPFEIMKTFQDDSPEDADFNIVCWARDPGTLDPLLCLGGDSPFLIRVLNIKTEEVQTTLSPHGGSLGDIKTHPFLPHIVASCAEDHETHLWDLTEQDPRRRLKAILAGQAQSSPIMTLAFHPGGRFLLSGCEDTSISLWLLPDLVDGEDSDDEVEMDAGVQMISSPHFSSVEVHSDHINCVEFMDDYILSMSTRESFMALWRIVGFSSQHPPPRSAAPTTDPAIKKTRSAWAKDPNNAFQIMMKFSNPNCTFTWSKFALCPSPKPLLIVGSNNNKVSMWDFDALQRGIHGNVKVQAYEPGLDDDASFTDYPFLSADAKEVSLVSIREWDDPLEEEYAHKTIVLPFKGGSPGKRHVRALRAFSFSKGGQWCVIASDDGQVSVLRWDPVKTG